MAKIDKQKEFKKTQSTSSPGALGEEVNRPKKRYEKPISKETLKTSNGEGLNEENSAGDAGPFEGLENSAEN